MLFRSCVDVVALQYGPEIGGSEIAIDRRKLRRQPGVVTPVQAPEMLVAVDDHGGCLGGWVGNGCYRMQQAGGAQLIPEGRWDLCLQHLPMACRLDDLPG